MAHRDIGLNEKSYVVVNTQFRFDIDSTAVRILVKGHYVHFDVTRKRSHADVFIF